MMIVEVPRRWRWAIGTLAAVSLIEMLALWGAGSVPQDAPPAEVALASTVPASVDNNAEPFVPAASPPSSPPAGEEIEVCGGGWTRGASRLTDVSAWLKRDDVQRSRTRVLDRMRSAGGDFGRVVATWLTLRGPDMPPLDAPASAAPREAVAMAATTTGDPRVYAFAFGLCRVGADSSTPFAGACQMIDARQWARLDPANASPWLYVYADAARRKDRATQDEALFRIASAQRSQTYFTALPGAVVNTVANASSADPSTTVAAMAMATDALGVATTFLSPDYRAMLSACRGAELADANRRQNCEAVAALLSERSDTVEERLVGAHLMVALGAPQSHLDEMRGTYYAFADKFDLGVLDSEGAPLDCGSMRRNLRRLAQFAAIGEAQTARDWAAQTGKSPAEFGAEYRAQQEQEKLRKAAQRGGAAASSVVASANR